MKIIELDLTGCTHQIDIQKRIKVAFDFPDCFLKNCVRRALIYFLCGAD